MREKEIKGSGSAVAVGVSGEDGFPRRATLLRFGDRIDPECGTIRTRAKFTNSDGLLLPGMFARVHMTFGKAKSVIVMPRNAVLRDQDKDYVLVVNDRNQVERRAVVTESLVVPQGPGLIMEGPFQLVFIKEGLRPEDWVIIDHNNELKPGDPVEVKR